MLKNKIYKYFATEIFKSFLTILFALTAIAWTVRAVSFLDLIVENGHSISTYLLYSLYNISNIVTKFIPLSFLLSLVFAILRFEKNSEFIILWTHGLNKIKVANLFFLISLVILFLQLLFAVIITPTALNESRRLVKISGFESINSIIKINNFSDSFKNLTFFVEERSENNLMKNIFIRDEGNAFSSIVSGDRETSNTTIIAKTGIIKNKKLILTDGFMQTQSKNKQIKNVAFSRTELSLAALTPRTITKTKLQETSTYSLYLCLFKKKDKKILETLHNCPPHNMDKDLVSTILRRFGMPMYIPIVALICSFLLVSRRKENKFLNRYKIFLLSFLVLLFAELLVRYSGFSTVHSILYILTPFLLMPLIYLLLINKLIFERKK